MISSSAAYQSAIVGDSRRIRLRAVVDISDPDKRFTPVTASPEAPWSKKEELHDYSTEDPPRYATLEPGRWLLGGGFKIFPDNYVIPQEVGYASCALSGPDGTLLDPVWVSLNFTGVSILQAFSIHFDSDPLDGVPEDFTVEVAFNGQVYFSQEVTGNQEVEVQFKNFTVYDPTSIKITVTKWSLPGRRVRLTEIAAGVFERWDLESINELSISQQAAFDCLTLPYGTASIEIDNTDRRFEPRRKDGIFQSIEDRQGIDFSIGVDTDSGTDYKPVGRFFQAGDGWKTSQNDAFMKWSLVDIVGLVCNRTFIVPDALPTTLEGWIKSIVSQLGDAFKNFYTIDQNYKSKAVTANSKADVTGKSCGDILRWACMATGTWPRADSETGVLAVEPLWNQGIKMTLEAMNDYPSMKANESIAVLIFQLADGNGTNLVVSGNSTSSNKTVTIQNPFIHNSSQALEASRLILSQYGGNIYEITGRGNPASEIGDVDTIWLDESNAATARRMMQTFEIRDGVLQGCRVTGLQADGSYRWTEYAIMDADKGDWTAPEGVEDFRLVLSDGGQGGGVGQEGQKRSAGSSNISFSGYNTAYGEQGVNGQGGKVWFGVIKLNPGSTIHYKRGAGGAPGSVYGQAGALGQHSTFGAYSSENGTLYPDGYTDIANGQAFCRPGVPVPLPGSGDGGKGGDGGDPPEGYLDTYKYTPIGAPSYVVNEVTKWVETKPAGPGHPGAWGGSGFIMLTWEKPDAAI